MSYVCLIKITFEYAIIHEASANTHLQNDTLKIMMCFYSTRSNVYGYQDTQNPSAKDLVSSTDQQDWKIARQTIGENSN